MFFSDNGTTVIAPMACTTISDLLAYESGRISRELYRRMWAGAPWIQLMPRGVFPSGMGYSLAAITYERNAPATASPAWSTISLADGEEGGNCLPSGTAVTSAYTSRTFSVKRRRLYSQDFCAEDLRFMWQVKDQLDAIYEALAGRTRLEWEIHDRFEYFLNCLHKVSVDGCPPSHTSTMASTYPASCPNALLSQGILDQWRLKLVRDGVPAASLTNGAPNLVLICSAETSERIIFDNDDVRQDIRFATQGQGNLAPLLAGIGADRVYKGFHHVVDPYPRRFTCAKGAFTEVAPFVGDAATKGTKYEVNSAWETAPYEESFIFSQSTMLQLIPEPVTSPGGNTRFDPISYTGDWKFLNIPDRTCNPRGNIGFFDGILAAASKPVKPQHGVAFVHLRCDPACNLVSECGS